MCAIDCERHLEFRSLIRAGSAEPVDLYLRRQRSGVALANDTSWAVTAAARRSR